MASGRVQGEVRGGVRGLAALLLLRCAPVVIGLWGVWAGVRGGARGRGRLARAHGGVVGCADSAAMLGRGSRRRTRCALTRSAQTTATSQFTKHACPSAGMPRPGLRFSPPRKSPTPAGPGPARWGRCVDIGTGEPHARFSDRASASASASAWPWAFTPLPSGERLGEGPPLASLTPDAHQRRRPSPQPSPRGRGSNSQPRLDRRARPRVPFQSGRQPVGGGAPVARREAQRSRPQACRRTGLLRDLTRGICPSRVNAVNVASYAAGRFREHRRGVGAQRRPRHRSTAAHGLPAALARKPECDRITPQAHSEAQTARNPGGRA